MDPTRYIEALVKKRNDLKEEVFSKKLDHDSYREALVRVEQLEEIINHARTFFKGGEEDE